MRNTHKALLVALFIGSLTILPVSSYADWHGQGGHSHDSGHSHDGGHGHDGWSGHSYVGVNFSLWPDSYYYGAPYYPTPDEVLVSPPVTVVQQPVTVIQPESPVITTAGTSSDITDVFTVNIPNDKGGYTAVTLKRSENGFIGPQGEFYPEFPKVFQLKVMYGK